MCYIFTMREQRHKRHVAFINELRERFPGVEGDMSRIEYMKLVHQMSDAMEAGYTQKQLAEFLGIHQNTVGRYENGKTDIPSHVAVLLRMMHRLLTKTTQFDQWRVDNVRLRQRISYLERRIENLEGDNEELERRALAAEQREMARVKARGQAGAS